MTCKPSKTLQVISSTRGWIHSLYPVYDAPIKGIRLHNNVMYMGKIIKAFYVFLLHNIYISNTKNDWITYWTSTPTYAIIWALSFKVTYLLKIYSPITMYFFGFLRQSSSQLLFLFIKTTEGWLFCPTVTFITACFFFSIVIFIIPQLSVSSLWQNPVNFC